MYCITQEMYICEYVCKTCHKEFAFSLKYGETFKILLQPVTCLKMLLIHRYFSAIFQEQVFSRAPPIGSLWKYNKIYCITPLRTVQENIGISWYIPVKYSFCFSSYISVQNTLNVLLIL